MTGGLRFARGLAVVRAALRQGKEEQPDDLMRRHALTMVLATQPQLWIDRRHETFTWLDDSTITRRMSVTFRLDPERLGDAAEGLSLVYLPLALLDKRSLVNFDLFDASGTALPSLNQQDNSHVAADGLTQVINGLLDQQLAQTQDALQTAAAADRPALTQAEQELLSDLNQDLYTPLLEIAAADDGTALAETFLTRPGVAQVVQSGVGARFAVMTRQLGTSFLLLVPAQPSPDPAIVKFQYEARWRWWTGGTTAPDRIRTAFNAVGASFGFLPKRVRFEQIPVGWGRSYHAEVVAPEDAYLALSTLTTTPTGDVPLAPVISKRPARANLKARIVSKDDAATLTEEIWARRPGVFASYVLVAALSAGSLLAAAENVERLDGQTVAAVLLLIPTAAFALLSRPGEHGYTTRLLAGVRVLGLVAVVCAMILSVMIGVGAFKHQSRHPIPIGAETAAHTLAFVACSVALLLAMGLFAPRRRVRRTLWSLAAWLTILEFIS